MTKRNYLPENYLDNRSRVNTGDLILFSGKGLFSSVIKKVTQSSISHIGMALVFRDNINDMVLVVESMYDRNVKKGGPTVNELSEHIHHYEGDIYLRRCGRYLSSNELMRFDVARQKFKNLPYEPNFFNMLLIALRLTNKDGTGLASFFCSELVAAILQYMNLIDERFLPSAYLPCDFLPGGLADNHFKNVEYSKKIIKLN